MSQIKNRPRKLTAKAVKRKLTVFSALNHTEPFTDKELEKLSKFGFWSASVLKSDAVFSTKIVENNEKGIVIDNGNIIIGKKDGEFNVADLSMGMINIIALRKMNIYDALLTAMNAAIQRKFVSIFIQ